MQANGFYADDNRGYINFMTNHYLTGTNSDTWSSILYGGDYLTHYNKYVPKPILGKPTILRCPAMPDPQTIHRNVAYAMYNRRKDDTYVYKRTDHGDFSADNSSNVISYVRHRVRTPSTFVLLADSYTTTSSYSQKQYYQFSPSKITEADTSSGGIYLVHQNMANSAFFDGHVATLSARKLAESPGKILYVYSPSGEIISTSL